MKAVAEAKIWFSVYDRSPAPAQSQPRPAMPYLMIQTNLPLGKKAERAILKNASTLIAELLEKPESFVMIALETDTPMLFAGSDDPVAFLELKSIGLSARKTKDLSEALCQLIEGHLGIARDRVYVKFIDVKGSMWGWKGDTF
jgi:phenylpyruvate tautomerase